MKTIMIGAALVIGLLSTETATAGPRKRQSIKHEQVQHHHRIRQGLRSGELTKKEAAQLQLQQSQIQRYTLLAKCDGKVTRKERAFIQAEQARAGAHIYHKKHNCRTR
jgi:hypothetical protein